MKLLENQSIRDALSAVMAAQERSERSLSFMDITGYEGSVIGTSISRMVEQIEVCVREISDLMSVLRESEDPVRPVEPAGEDPVARKVFEQEAERFWREHMRLIHAVERCALRVDAARAQGDVCFMDGILEVREAEIPPEDEAALTDIFLSLKDVYDAAAEAAETVRLSIARNS